MQFVFPVDLHEMSTLQCGSRIVVRRPFRRSFPRSSPRPSSPSVSLNGSPKAWINGSTPRHPRTVVNA